MRYVDVTLKTVFWVFFGKVKRNHVCRREQSYTGRKGQRPGLAEESGVDAAAKDLVSRKRAVGGERQGSGGVGLWISAKQDRQLL